MSNQRAGVNQHGVLLKVAQDADKLHPWPTEISLGPSEVAAVSVFHKLQGQRAYADWSEYEVLDLARLAAMLLHYNEEWRKYIAEGSIIMGGKAGRTSIQNPRSRVCHDLGSAINSLSRRLNLNGLSTSEKRSMSKRTEVEREMRPTFGTGGGGGDHLEDEGLLN